MNRSRKTDIIVGLFVIIALAVLFAMTFAIRGTSGMSPYRLNVQFRDVAGLEIGAPVLVQGFRLGRVAGMAPAVDADGEQAVLVEVTVSRQIPLYQDAQVKLVQQGFLGDKRLEVDPGTKDAGPIDEDSILIGVPPPDLSTFIAQGQAIVDDVQAVVRNLRTLTGDPERIARIDQTLANVEKSSAELSAMLEENRAALRQSLQNIQDVSSKATGIADKAERIVTQAETSVGDVQAMVAELRQDRVELREKVDAILDNTNQATARADELVANVQGDVDELTTQLREASQNINEIVARINNGEGTVGRLLTDPRPFEDLQASVAALRSIVLQEQNNYYDRRIPYRSAPGAGTARTPGASGLPAP